MINNVIGYIVNFKDIEENKVALIFQEYTLEEEKKRQWKLHEISCCQICGKSIYHVLVPAEVCKECFNTLKDVKIEFDKTTYIENNSISFTKFNLFLKTLNIFPENYIYNPTFVKVRRKK